MQQALALRRSLQLDIDQSEGARAVVVGEDLGDAPDGGGRLIAERAQLGDALVGPVGGHGGEEAACRLRVEQQRVGGVLEQLCPFSFDLCYIRSLSCSS